MKINKLIKSSSLNILILSILGIFLVVGGYFYSGMQQSSVNIVGGGEVVINSPAPISTPTSISCESINSLSLSGSCGANSYRYLSFSCSGNSTVLRQGSAYSCKTFELWYQEAKSTCSKQCVLSSSTPTPMPSLTPTPLPSPTPASTYAPGGPSNGGNWLEI